MQLIQFFQLRPSGKMSLTKDHASEGFDFFFSRFQALKNSQEIPILACL